MRFSSRLIINLENLSDNLSELKKINSTSEILFMIKADAYGHGLIEIARFAYTELNIKNFGVASISEAIELRTQSPEIKANIYVFSDLSLNNAKARESYTQLAIDPVISNLDDLRFILENSDFRFLPLTLFFDIGMGRLGILPDECEELAILLKKHGRRSIAHLMGHFSSSFIKLKDNDRTHRQFQVFQNIKSDLKARQISIDSTSLANSGAIEQGIGQDETHIRPGLMLYGPSSLMIDKPQWQGKLLSRFETEIIDIMEVKKGRPIGYGAHICNEDGVIVYIPIGYGDGLLTYYSSLKLQLSIGECKILGRINMDMTALFVKSLPPNVQKGDALALWGSDSRVISHIARSVNTHPYQIFCAISSRIPRYYRLHSKNLKV